MTVKVWNFVIVFAVSVLAASSQTCPSDHFSTVFAATVDQTIVDLNIVVDDPDFYFFKNVLKLRDEEIPDIFEEALNFFNSTFGLDFSVLDTSELNDLSFENARMSVYSLPDSIEYYVTTSNWIRNGNTRSTCYRIREGGIRVFFTADQILYGTYGGAEGKSAGVTTQLAYGFYQIDACQQSPVVIQYQTITPFRAEPVDGILINNSDLYNRVLGHGKAQGIGYIVPDLEEPGRFHFVVRNVFTFSPQ